MSEAKPNDGAIRNKGAEPSLIEYFEIEGLHGYRSLSLKSDYTATILIAKNGIGKTTLLGALDAFLRLQLSRLRNLEFSIIRCKLRIEEQEFCLSHNDVIEFLQIPVEGEIVKLASRVGVEPAVIFNFILDEWDPANGSTKPTSESKVYSELVSAFNYSSRDADGAISKVRDSLMERQPTVSLIFNKMRKALAGTEIVYLPTYRRIELALRHDPRDPSRRRARPKFDVATGSLFTGEIQFGLADISDRLSQLNEEIIFKSNIGYREISANIINELLDGVYEKEPEPGLSILPSKEELELFFERLERARKRGPYAMPVSIPNLEKIYSRSRTHKMIPISAGL